MKGSPAERTSGTDDRSAADDPGARLRSVALDDEHVGFDTATGRLVVANTVGLAMWHGLVHGWSSDRIVADVERRFDAPRERIARDLDAFVERLECESEARSRRSGLPGPILDPVPTRPFAVARRVRWPLGGTTLIVESESRDIVEALERVLGHALEDEPASSGESRAGEHRVRLWSEGGRYPLSFRGATVDTGLHVDDAVTRLARGCASVIAGTVGWVAALHAAAIERAGRAIVMPAASGSGKTTLAAWLVGRGRARLVNDDLVVLRRGDLSLVPAAYPLSIKNGSVPVLSALWPTLPALPVRRDRRGREIRELGLPATDLCDAPSGAIAIVVPARASDARPVDGVNEATLSELSRASVLRSLVDNGLTLAPGTDWETVRALIHWIEAVPCLRLDYRDLPAAERALERLWDPGPTPSR